MNETADANPLIQRHTSVLCLNPPDVFYKMTSAADFKCGQSPSLLLEHPLLGFSWIVFMLTWQRTVVRG